MVKKPGTIQISGVAFRELREGAMMSQRDFSVAAAMSVESVKRWEGETSVYVHLSTIRKIATAVDQPVATVFAKLTRGRLGTVKSAAASASAKAKKKMDDKGKNKD